MSSEDENLDMFGFDGVDLNAVESVIEDDEKSPDALRQIYALFKNELEQEAALRLLASFCKHFGGFPVYVPKGRKLEAELKKISIWNDFDGRNVEELAKKYRVSVFHVYHVIKQMRKAEHDKRQPKLF
ncbi:Mor transcription activator family protein [Vibrio navarrensis]|uniref:Mor transcription activator family protein n=1 Tax=Vibrio navarrensis TaxID=29495 RepID=UPI001302B143|nr:Mor transcription activator family protein [Vibrio navarrensis]